MKSRTLLLTVAILLLGAQALAADSKGPLVTDPDWDRRPLGDDVAKYYPDKAMTNGISGKAIIACRIAVTGYLENCRIMDEAPAGQDFGVASVRMAEKRLFHMKPMSLMGRPVGGQVVFVPVVWLAPDSSGYPRTDFRPGDNALLLTPDPAGSIRCPTAAAPGQMCKPHTVSWTEQPMFLEIKAQQAAGGALEGLSQLNCQIQPDLRLKDCKIAGVTTPAAVAAATAIADGLLAPAKAEDGTATVGARIVVTLNWTRLIQKMAAYDKVTDGL
ncbi:hypothetical protein QO010_000939 [Caulobacter ginsengisoli]|uniref:TonB C-terminal domain-containing protein n=1 Tax=Caulobacter ginsengisoli TaxID=400775 RepID=A0ABU0IMF0_9CAUL|nr:energy transducer TonB [Caulobacter ginsengisoli]MDQ0463191.1 hypothetical protein [Caulobacter ginsengisoli]